MKKNFFFLTVITAILTFSFTGCGEGESKSTLYVGALLPQTGAGAVFAEYIQKGLDLAVEEINSREPGSIIITYSDTKNDPKEGISVFQQMVLTKKPPVVITALSSVTKAVAPLAKPNNTVLIGTAVGLPGVTSPSEYVFRVYPEAHGLAGVIAKYAASRFKTAVVIYINDDFGVSGAGIFQKEFEAAGGKVLLKEPYIPIEKDFKTQWERIKAIKPECVWVTGYGPAYSVIVRQMRESQVSSVLLADMTLGLPVTLKNVKEGAEGVVYVDGPMKDDFILRYQKKYGERPTSYAGYAYDIIMMLDLVRKQNGINPDKIREGFSSIKNYQGVMGDISILPSRDASLRFVLMKITNGQPNLYNE